MKTLTRRYFILGGAAVLAAAGGYSWKLWRDFGSLPASPPSSPNYRAGAFQNLPDDYVYAGLEREPLHDWG